MKQNIAVFGVCLAALLYLAGCNEAVNLLPPATKEDTGGLTQEELDALNNGGKKPAPKEYLTSVGLAAAGSTTYFIDAANGNDANNGITPQTAWKSFKNPNATTFQPGDHILLNADSIWNGVPVTTDNYTTLLASDTVGMLWPKGNGTVDKPIVIDFYVFKAGDTAPSFSSEQRPIINGNGTPSRTNAEPYNPSGAIYLYDQTCWEIRNIEVTNTFENPLTYPNHWYNYEVRKGLCGILIDGNGTKTNRSNHLYIMDCYVHDVQSEHTNNKSDWWKSSYFGGTHNTSKGVGGIIIGSAYDDIKVERNIVKRVGLEGLRTAGGDRNHTNVVFRNNFVEAVAGDGIVLAQTSTTGTAYPNIVEYNITKDSCAAPNLGTANYAGCWAYYANGAIFQYNECYGILYGYLDGQAWDIDNACDKLIYQYNYSHHNSGGTVLFMSGITNGIFRYNIGANDGGGSRYMATVDQNGIKVSATANSYTAWPSGKAFIHYVPTETTGKTLIPLVYNNTFYIGAGITVGVFGHNDTSAPSKYVRFYNNILLKEGEGTVYLCRGYQGGNYPGQINSPAAFKNNILWAASQSQFNNGSGVSIANLLSTYGNKWEDPKLVIQLPGSLDTLRKQRDTELPTSAMYNPAKLKTFTGIERLRARASIFTPQDGSPAIGTGMSIPAGDSSVDGAWNAPALTKDMFDSDLDFEHPPIGAAAKRYITILNPAD